MNDNPVLFILALVAFIAIVIYYIIKAGTKSGLIQNDKVSKVIETIDYIGDDMVRDDVKAKRLADRLNVDQMKKKISSVDFEDEIRLKKTLNELLKDNQEVKSMKLDNKQKKALIEEIRSRISNSVFKI